jgi:hypothetical protein
VLAPWREHWVFWPPDGEGDVPLRFTPEVPSPVPGADQSRWGYPITLQVSRPRPEEPLDLTLTLTRGADGSDEPVPCIFLTPEAPANR